VKKRKRKNNFQAMSKNRTVDLQELRRIRAEDAGREGRLADAFANSPDTVDPGPLNEGWEFQVRMREVVPLIDELVKQGS